MVHIHKAIYEDKFATADNWVCHI
ncbi:hypothetical protein OOU_Y34scaffold00540g2 [Pyricularia oryzae Y34]|uniref:Uncharacterized protein n=2 Tax=Pyricularia oryzae TaxID=318829 RepID=A0AA97NYA1_PYRO3|nr:hypothetical protein OOU_Y34scaffold00540g2 [Pyricularia oryzae Y34]